MDKKQLKKQFEREWQTHYKLNTLIDRGFSRRKCSSCGVYFWSIPERTVCGDASCIGYEFIGNPPTKKKLTYLETWEKIKNYFTSNGHGYVKPYPSVARWRDDLYFTIASINDFQPYVVNGEIDPPHNPLIVPQPCIRFVDISNVGVTGRHYTNFIMIGQHAFNTDKTGLFYWKEEAIAHDINYLLSLGIPEEELIFHEDVWAGGGNFGPSIEYFVRGLELGNCVFMQYEYADGKQRELPTKVIDMGAGLSRLAWITTGDPTSYEVVFGPVIDWLKKSVGVSVDEDLLLRYAKLSGKLNEEEVEDIEEEKARVEKMLSADESEFKKLEELQALYACTDHIKTLLLATTDGMLPSNSGGGYNLRLLVRRVFGFEQKYGFEVDWATVAEKHAQHLKPLLDHLDPYTLAEILKEERRKFLNTKEKATRIIINLIKKAKQNKKNTNKEFEDNVGKISKEDVLLLYKSHGIPPEAIEEVAKENNVRVEIPGNFYQLVKEQEEGIKKEKTSRLPDSKIAHLPKTEVLYYSDVSEFTAKVLDLVDGLVVLDKSAFYPEGGGQVSDTGKINDVEVVDVFKQGGIIFHKVKDPSTFNPGDEVIGWVDLKRRKTISRHHTVTHMVNAACREILGRHIWQAGSHKDPEKAHLDVTHYKKITEKELEQIEHLVNRHIMENMPVVTEVLPRTEAEQKYGFTLYQGGAVPGKKLRIVSIGEIDHEACGGTHTMIRTTGELGCFKIVKKESVKDGVERLIYKCGEPAIIYIQKREQLLKQSSSILSVSEDELPKSVKRFFEEWKEQRKTIEKLREQVIKSEVEDLEHHKKVMKIVGLDREGLQKMAGEMLKRKVEGCLINHQGHFICVSSNGNAKTYFETLKNELDASGGGKDNFVQGKVKKIKEISL